MRKLLPPLLAVLTLLIGCHFVLPFWTALELKRAIRSGDAATVEARVEWDSVRASLRQSLTEQAPQEARRRFGNIPIFHKLAEKIALNYSRPVVDKMVDSFGNADGLIRFYSWRETVNGQKSSRTLAGIAQEMMGRVKRVSFASLTRLEVTIADRMDPQRLIFSALELRGSGWKLTEVRLLPRVE